SVTSRVLYAAAADPRTLPPFPTRRSSDLQASMTSHDNSNAGQRGMAHFVRNPAPRRLGMAAAGVWAAGLLLSGCSYVSDELWPRSEEHTSELQSRENLVCRLLLEKKKNTE